MNRALRGIMLCGCLALLAACGRNPAPAPEVAPMQAIRIAEWSGIVADFRPDILVVDLWASWCVSCIERFPHMVEMHGRYAGRGVSFATLNFDDPADTEALEWSNRFLARIDARFPHYHVQENLLHSFEVMDLQTLPVVLIFDGAGRERYRLTNDNPNDQFDEADVERAILALLGE